MDHRWCFGLRCAPYIFNEISDFVVGVAHKLLFVLLKVVLVSRFCDCFNGKCLILKKCSDVPITTDSSFKGYGAWCGKDYLYRTWKGVSWDFRIPEHWVDPPEYDIVVENINVLELWLVSVGVKRWGGIFSNTQVNVRVI